MSRVLVTGGAGFIGSHTVDALVEGGHDTTVLDVLDEDVHGPNPSWPGFLNPAARAVRGDVRDEELLEALVAEADVIFHLAARTGVGQSMYELRGYFDVNVGGTAGLLEAVLRRQQPLQRLVVASSRAVYGEGTYRCGQCGPVTPLARDHSHLVAGKWEPPCPSCGGPAAAVPTDESARLLPGSIYGVTKLCQEQACLVAGAAHGFPVVALRYFNVFGSRQSQHNPYTGVVTTFVNRISAGRPPEVYEDGDESRDYVHVSDVVRANVLAMESDRAVGRALNVGSGERITVLAVASAVAASLGGPPPVVNAKFRVGDVRHCFADLRLSRSALGYEPAVRFADAIGDLAREMGSAKGRDLSEAAEAELRSWGLSAEGRP